MIRAKFVNGYLRHVLAEGADVELRARFDVYEDRHGGELFARGERRECFAMTAIGCATPDPVHVWIKDDFLVDGRTTSSEQALLEMIADKVAHHFDLGERGTGAVIQAKSEGQYLLGNERGPGGPVHIRIEVYRDQSTRKLFATGERKRCYEVRRFGCGKPQHAQIWVRDDTLSALISDVSGTTSELFMEEVQDRIAGRFQLGDDMTLSRRDSRYLLTPFEIERVGIEDDFERSEVWVDVVSCARSGKTWLTAQESGLFELQPVDWEDVSHEDVLVDDAVANAVVRQVTGADPEALVDAAARMMARRFFDRRYLRGNKDG